jgi:cytochrome c peroxidase
MKLKNLVVLGVLLISSLACADGILVALPDEVPVPANNPITPAKVELGKKLYFDPRLSKNGKISCNSCHNVMKGGEDNSPTSTGINGKHGGRSAPTVWNSAFLSVQFWDGRASSLEEQAKGPMLNPVEMGMGSHDEVMTRLKKIPGYQKMFKNVFGSGDATADPTSVMTIDNAVRAIAAYERTLVTRNSPFDRFIKGDQTALTPAAKNGYQLVQTVGCVACHNGPNFAGPKLPEGTGFYQKFPTFPGTTYETKYHLADDMGRYEVTRNEADRHMWRVPTWRNIALTAPYFHNGSVKTLDEAVRVMAKVQLNKELQPGEVHDIVAFLQSLTGERPKQTKPELPKGSKDTIF